MKWRRRTKPVMSLALRRFALAARSRLPAAEALAIIAKDSDSTPETADVMSGIASQVASGSSVGDALRRYPDTFPAATVELVRASDPGPGAAAVYDMLARDFEQREDYGKALKAAMAWPLLALVAFAVVFMMATTFLLPPFEDLFASFNAQLPGPTRLLLSFSKGALIWIPLLAVSIALAWTFRSRMRWPQRWGARLPVMRSYLRRVFTSRLATTLLAAIDGGPPRELLEHLRATVASDELAASVTSLQARLDSGSGLAQAVRDTPSLPSRVRVSAELGARGGDFGEALRQTLELNDEETRHALLRLERTMLVGAYLVAAFLVAFLVIALYLPIFKMGSAI